MVISMLATVAFADNQVLEQYTVNNLNVNAQTASIVQGIQEFGATQVQIQYAGAYIFLANEVMVGITSQSSVPVQLVPLNAYYTYNNGQITVSLIGDPTKQSGNDTSNQQSSGSFFDYTTPESGFFYNQ
jgi:negative regulator of sigma E activity